MSVKRFLVELEYMPFSDDDYEHVSRADIYEAIHTVVHRKAMDGNIGDYNYVKVEDISDDYIAEESYWTQLEDDAEQLARDVEEEDNDWG